MAATAQRLCALVTGIISEHAILKGVMVAAICEGKRARGGLVEGK